MTEIITSLAGVASAAIEAINSMMQFIFAIGLSLGLVTGPATDAPIEFKDSANVQMSAVMFADTHIRATAFNPYWLECGLEDIANSDEEFDALLIAGDLTEASDPMSYDILWDLLDKGEGYNNILLATGNHDIRLDYEGVTKKIMAKQSEYIGKEITKPYYSYDVEGITFIVMGSDSWELEKAHISKAQLDFIDSELARATADGKPAFVVCHQPLANTHGLPDVWKNGDLGEDSAAVREILTKYKNVFYVSGHLHDGVYEKSLEVFDAEKGVYGINLPGYGKDNDYGINYHHGLGTIVEVYEDEVVFTARDFVEGEPIEGYTKTFELVK